MVITIHDISLSLEKTMNSFLSRKTLKSLIAFSGVCFLSTASYASDYSSRYYSNDCYQNSNDQLAAGLFGALVGGVVGSHVAGRGDRTEGSVIGAILGGTTAAAISDSSRTSGYNPNCDKTRRQTRNRNYRNNQYSRNTNINNFSNQQDYYSVRNRVNSNNRRNSRNTRAHSIHHHDYTHYHEHHHDHHHD